MRTNKMRAHLNINMHTSMQKIDNYHNRSAYTEKRLQKTCQIFIFTETTIHCNEVVAVCTSIANKNCNIS